MRRTARRQIEREEQIYQLTTLVAGSFSLQEVLGKLAEAAVRITGVKACSIRLLDEESGDLKMRSTYGLTEEYRTKGQVTKDDPVVKAAFAGEAVILDDMRLDDRVKYKEATIKEGLVSQLTVSMEFRGKPIGVLRLYTPTAMHFHQEDIVLARAVASQCAVAITNAKLYAEAIEGARIAEQMRLGGVIQRRMIPQSPPQAGGLDIAASYIPCFDVGGDFYDFFQPRPDRIAVQIADVAGKGIPAALMMSCFKGAVSAYADSAMSLRDILEADDGSGPFREVLKNRLFTRDKHAILHQIIGKLNKMALGECREGEFVTLFYAFIDTTDRTITYCNCGHEPAILIRNGQTTDLDKGGLILGVMQDSDYEIETIGLKEGDCLLLYTDGLIDTINFDGELWGRERLVETATMLTDCTANQMIKNILAQRRRFSGLASQTDDTSIIVIKVDANANKES